STASALPAVVTLSLHDALPILGHGGDPNPRERSEAMMPVPQFVLDLRARIGHDLLWLTGVNAVTVDEHQRLLLARRADTGRWALISGILEPGEQPAPGLAREVREETGVVVQPLRITSVMSGRPVRHTNGDWAQYLSITFEC